MINTIQKGRAAVFLENMSVDYCVNTHTQAELNKIADLRRIEVLRLSKKI